MRISLCETISSAEKRSSNTGLKICTCCRAICARRRRRISSSLLPLNMLPVMTSIQPWVGERKGTSISGLRAQGVAPSRSHSRLILAGFGAHADAVAFVDKRRHLHHEPGFGHRRLHLSAGGGALDPRGRFRDKEINGGRQIDSDRLITVKLHLYERIGLQVADRIAEHFTVDVDLLVVCCVHEVKRVAVAVE